MATCPECDAEIEIEKGGDLQGNLLKSDTGYSAS